MLWVGLDDLRECLAFEWVAAMENPNCRQVSCDYFIFDNKKELKAVLHAALDNAIKELYIELLDDEAITAVCV